jgi:hypothetical protein
MDSSRWDSQVSTRRQMTIEEARELERLFNLGHKNADILCALRVTFPGRFEGDAGRKQVDRTVRQDLKPNQPDRSNKWTFSTHCEDYDPESARLVLDMLAWVSYASTPPAELKGGAKITHITVEEAKWIIRLRRAYPDMPNEWIWHFARRYVALEVRNESTAPLDKFISAKFWQVQKDTSSEAVREAWAAADGRDGPNPWAIWKV